VITSLDLGDVDDRSFVVVATQGHYDEDSLERALATPAIYVGLVASAKRAGAVLGYLRDRGVAADALERVHAPAGLDLGHIATDEIAVAILAEIVRLRAAGELDAYFGDKAILIAQRHASDKAEELLISRNTFTSEPYALAMPRDDEALRLAIDRALSHIYRSGAIYQVFSKHFGKVGPEVVFFYSVMALPE